MATSVESEHNILQLCLACSAVIICIIGLMIHLFIVGVSIIDRLKGRPLTTTDLLITSIETSRGVFQLISLFDLFWRTFCEEASIAYDITFLIIADFSTDCNICLSVLLSVFYTLKISNFQNVFFLYLKKIIAQRVLGMITTFVLLSIGISSGFNFTTFLDAPKNSTQEGNHYIVHSIMYGIYVLWDFLPILFYLVSSLTLLGSLCRHMHRMNHGRNVRSHLDAYFKTMTFIIVSLFCFVLFVSSKMLGVHFFNSLNFTGFFLVWNCFPALHSIYIIYMTMRLRNHFFNLLDGVTKCLLLGGGSGSRSGVQILMTNQ